MLIQHVPSFLFSSAKITNLSHKTLISYNLRYTKIANMKLLAAITSLLGLSSVPNTDLQWSGWSSYPHESVTYDQMVTALYTNCTLATWVAFKDSLRRDYGPQARDLPNVKSVSWDIYGYGPTIFSGDLQHPNLPRFNIKQYIYYRVDAGGRVLDKQVDLQVSLTELGYKELVESLGFVPT